jgi:hypothetical protein
MPSSFRNGGFIGIPRKYASIHEPIADFALINFSNAIDNNNLIVPTTAQVGDLAILTDNVESSPVVDAPSGWTTVLAGSAGNTAISVTVAYKILTASDIGATVTSTNTSTTHHFMQIAVVGTNTENAAFSSVTISGLLSTVTTTDPASQNIVLSGVTLPAFGVVVYAQRGSASTTMIITTTPINDAVADTLDGANIKIRTHLKFFGTGTTPAEAATTSTMTMNLGDAGQQGQIGFVVTPTSATGIKEYSSGIWALDDVLETTYYL